MQINLDQMDLRLNIFRPIHAGAVERMTESLERYGQLTPVTAVDDGNRMVLIDGFKRHRSATTLGLTSLAVTPLKVTGCQAKALVFLLNRSTGFSVIAEARLVRDLMEVEGLNQTETALLLERHKSWVSRRLDLIRTLSPEVAEDIDLNLIPGGGGSSLARLPQGNQADFCVAIQKHRLKAQEIKKLVDLWCKAQESGIRHYLLTSPREALEIASQGDKRWFYHLKGLVKTLSNLNRQLNKRTLLEQSVPGLLRLLDQAESQMKTTRELIQGGHHEPIR